MLLYIIFYLIFALRFLKFLRYLVFRVPFFIFVISSVNFVNLFKILSSCQKMKKLTKMNEYISFLEASKMYGISESTFRRKLKNLTDKDLTKLTKRMNGRVYISVKELSVFEKIDKNENQIFIQDKEPNNMEIIHLIKQNEKLLQMNQDKDEQIKTLTGYVVQLQNDIQGYIKQLNSGEPNKSEKSDFVLKIIVFSLIIILTIYLIFEPG